MNTDPSKPGWVQPSDIHLAALIATLEADGHLEAAGFLEAILNMEAVARSVRDMEPKIKDPVMATLLRRITTATTRARSQFLSNVLIGFDS